MIKWLKREIKRMTCKHMDCSFIRNIGGDEQMYHYVKGCGLARSEHVCVDCGCIIYRTERY